MMENDYEMALLLQKQFEHESQIDSPKQNLVYAKKTSKDTTKSLTDPSWEVIDPNPDIHVLFMAFNDKYFWNKLLAVSVSWSKRMTSCAGVCRYQGRGGLCEIALSEPLLKLRPRKDLVETLLHEMIHAYLFVTANNKDRDGHGPEFHKHMYRINAESGTNITVFHSFHDEVLLYQQHWWRCNGPCQHRKPYFGMIRRATNRAPGINDRWWSEHQKHCGGTFIKVKEPEKTVTKKPQQQKPVSPKNDIRSFYPVLKNNSQTRNSSGTIAITKKTEHLHDSKSGVTPIIPFTGSSHILTETAQDNNNRDYSLVRNHWANKFPQKHVSKRSCDEIESVNYKRVKTDIVYCPVCQVEVAASEVNHHLDMCLNKSNEVVVEKKIVCLVCNEAIFNKTLTEHLDECVGDAVFSNADVIEVDTDNECDNGEEKLYNCPVCLECYSLTKMTTHLDNCLIKEDISSALLDEDF